MIEAVIVSTARTPVGKAYHGAFNDTHGAMQAIGLAAQRIIVDGEQVIIAGDVESVSLTQKNLNRHRETEDWLIASKPEVYWSMIETADLVAQRYQISRDRQDEFVCESQRRTAAAQQAGRFDAEIVPLPTTKIVVDKDSDTIRREDVVPAADEGNRPDTTLDGLARLAPLRGEGHFITAGNASQLSDGASACAVMNARLAEQRDLDIPGYDRGIAVAGCEPEEMGTGPVFAVLLDRHGLKIADIDLCELNEAFVSQAIYCRDVSAYPVSA